MIGSPARLASHKPACGALTARNVASVAVGRRSLSRSPGAPRVRLWIDFAQNIDGASHANSSIHRRLADTEFLRDLLRCHVVSGLRKIGTKNVTMTFLLVRALTLHRSLIDPVRDDVPLLAGHLAVARSSTSGADRRPTHNET